MEGDIPDVQGLLRGRMSSPLKAVMNTIQNTDYAGRPLTGTDAYGRDIPALTGVGNLSREVIDVFLPQYFDAAYNYGQGNYGLGQAASQALEIPLQFHRPYYGPRRSW